MRRTGTTAVWMRAIICTVSTGVCRKAAICQPIFGAYLYFQGPAPRSPSGLPVTMSMA